MEQFYTRNNDPRFWQNQGNTRSYNCGSFALNAASWFAPYDNGNDYTEATREQLFRDLLDEGYEREDVMDFVLRRDQEEILRACPWLEPVLPDEVSKEERLIAYRISFSYGDFFEGFIDEDFHFRVRIGGFWFEKCGVDPIKFCDNQNIQENWVTTPWLIYDSEIVYFRIRQEI